jgi:hypothetical protein
VDNKLTTGHELPQTQDEILQLLQRAETGDESVCDQVRELLMFCPEFAELLGGDLEQVTERLLAKAVAGDNIVFREAIKTQMENLRRDLAGPAATPLESLLVDRIVMCWLQVQTADIAQAKGKAPTPGFATFQLRRQDSANRRYLAAIRSLATVRKMALPALQVNVGQHQTNIAGGTEA